MSRSKSTSHIPITYEIALAAARDTANAQMRASGRKAWSQDDFALACRTIDELYFNAWLTNEATSCTT